VQATNDITAIEKPEKSCPVCSSQVNDNEFRCAECDIPHHGDCAKKNGSCAIYGCDGDTFYKDQRVTYDKALNVIRIGETKPSSDVTALVVSGERLPVPQEHVDALMGYVEAYGPLKDEALEEFQEYSSWETILDIVYLRLGLNKETGQVISAARRALIKLEERKKLEKENYRVVVAVLAGVFVPLFLTMCLSVIFGYFTGVDIFEKIVIPIQLLGIPVAIWAENRRAQGAPQRNKDREVEHDNKRRELLEVYALQLIQAKE